MKLGDVKWAKKQTGERTVGTRKAGVTKGQGWEQGEEEERRDKQRNRGKRKDGVGGRGVGGGGKERKSGRENDNMSYFTYILSLKAEIERKLGDWRNYKKHLCLFSRNL